MFSPWWVGFKRIKMRFFLTITLILTSFLAVGQNDSLAVDSMAHHEVRMDSNALWALDQRLAKFESDHVLFAQSTSPLVDTINPLPLNDSIFKYYMADLDTRTPFEMTYNPVVKKYLQRYLKFGTTRLSRMMAHGQYYFPMFEEHLDKYDMPLEIKYLAVIESALNPKAKSYVGATGLWQFMYSTGIMYDLTVNSYVDDRNDPLKSTEAACQYMLKMYDVF